MQPVLQYSSNAFVINFYLSLIVDLLNTSRVMCFQKTVEVISRLIPWMSLINITAIFPQCLLSIMENIKREVFYSLRQVEGLLKKNQLLFHLQKINKVLGLGEGISLQFYQGLPYQSHCFLGCSKTAVFLQLHVWFTFLGLRGGEEMVLLWIHNVVVLTVLSGGCKDAHHSSSYFPAWIVHQWGYCPRKSE